MSKNRERQVDPAAFAPEDPRLLEAYQRERIVLYAEELPKGWASRTAGVEQAIEEGRLDGAAPSRVTLWRWWKRYTEAGRDYAALIDRPPSGRPPTPLDPWLERFLRRIVRARPNLGPKKLFEKGQTFASKSRRVGTAPRNVDQIRRWRNSIPTAELQMSQYGTRTARAETQLKRTYPTTRPHELWQVDEVQLPVWIRIWHAVDKKWVIAVAWGVFVRDHYSKAILGWWVKTPSLRRPFNTQFTAQEVLATIAGAAVPDLAHPVVRHMVTGDPEKVLMDGSGAMTKARATLKAKNLVDSSHSEPYAPWQNGGIENYFRTLKRRDLPELVGSKVEWIPFHSNVDPRTARDRNVDPSPKLREIPLMCLPRPEHLRWAVGHFVKEHNSTGTRPAPHRGMTPESVFLRDRERTARRPSRLVETFPVHQVSLQNRGLEIHNQWYQNEDLHHSFPHKSKLWVRKDPLERGVFVFPNNLAIRSRDQGLFVGDHQDWARTASPDEVAQALRKETKQLRQLIDEDRDSYTEEVIGKPGAELLAEAVDTREKEVSSKSRKGRRIEKGKEKRAQQELFNSVDPMGPERKNRQASTQSAEASVEPDPSRQPSKGQSAEKNSKGIPFTPSRRRLRSVQLVDENLAQSN